MSKKGEQLKTRRAAAFAAAAVCAALLTLASAREACARQANVGYVVSVRGEWAAGRGRRPLQRWEQVQAGAAVRALNPRDAEAYITIGLYDGRQPITQACARPGDCARPFVLPASGARQEGRAAVVAPKPRPPSGLVGAGVSAEAGGGAAAHENASFLERVVAVFSRREAHRAIHASTRGGESLGLADAVVAREGSKTDLGPALATAQEREYVLTAVPLGEDLKAARGGSVRVYLKWRKGDAASGTTEGLAPGLYSLSDEGRGEVWVLVVPRAEYGAASGDFRAAEAAVKSWRAKADETAARDFLRAALYQLAAQAGLLCAGA